MRARPARSPRADEAVDGPPQQVGPAAGPGLDDRQDARRQRPGWRRRAAGRPSSRRSVPRTSRGLFDAAPVWSDRCLGRADAVRQGGALLLRHGLASHGAPSSVPKLRLIDLPVDGAGGQQLGVRALGGDAAPGPAPRSCRRVSTVLMRWATTKRCGRAISSSSAAWILASVSTSTALVLSSRIRIARADQQRAGDGDALLLPAGEVDAALPDQRVVALGQAP